MSYILDALKRADRERTRGAPPDIHAQPWLPDGVERRGRGAAGRWPAILVGLAIGIVAASLAHWALVGSSPVPTAIPSAPDASDRAASAATAVPVTAVAPAAAVPPAWPSTASAVAGTSAVPVLPPAPPDAVTTAPFLPPPARPGRDPAGVRAAAVSSPAGRAADAASPTAVNATAMPLQALPDEVRRQLPALKVSGSIHSRRAADRLLVIDGQVAREGDSVAPDLVLERIEPRSATFRFKHHRFELAL